ncbi:PREDICTED: protein SCAR2-like [Nelumbo nucifera]|uniref:Protein SCAR n=1 Tax=Nelumbo nucifera TaxID=4432 RepID=A0A1U8APF0_NELNU|nr:PREDICTED: protein SCAR2-like [Nelumbo nucifera]
MPITRYQIRNEYSLADPELYKAADKDDPEALLEGVAMAGLVGVLRQLGDLAEFAAEIFHDLHEEVLATAARGHGLMIRVQQLEAEVPPIEKALLSQTNHSLFLFNTGVDWHPNLQMDQNLVSRGDLPRFVMDSYEECRGPPRLFLLDKFDVAGAGACLKRFSDPSFFKIKLTSSESNKVEIQREKKVRKVKRKGSRWRNGETQEAFPASDSKLHQLFSEENNQTENNVPGYRMKLKKRQLNAFPFDSTTGKSYMERFVESLSPKHKIVCESSLTSANLKTTSRDASALGSDIHEISTENPDKNILQQRKTSIVVSPSKQEKVLEPSMEELHEDAVEGLKKSPEQIPNNEVEKIPSTFYKPHNQGESTENQKESAVNVERKLEASGDGYQSDGNTSEVENYMDALATMESEIETDTESKTKNDRGFVNIERQGVYSDTNKEELELQAQFLDSHSGDESSVSDDGNISFEKGGSNFSNSDTLSSCAETAPSDGDIAAKVYPSIETCLDKPEDVSSKKLNGDGFATKSSDDMIPGGCCIKELKDPSHRPEFGQTSSKFSITESTTHFQLSSDISLNEFHLQGQESVEISSVSVKSCTGGSSSIMEDDGKILSVDLSCPISASDFSSQMKDDSLLKGPMKTQPEELDGVKDDFLGTVSAKSQHLEVLDGGALDRSSDALPQLYSISNLAPEKEESGTDFEEVPPTEYPEDVSSENFGSPHSVVLPTVQVHGLEEQNLEACSGTTQAELFPPTNAGGLEDVNPDNKVVETDIIVLSTERNSRYCEDGSIESSSLPHVVILPTKEHLEGLTGGLEACECFTAAEHPCSTPEHMPTSVSAGDVDDVKPDTDRDILLPIGVNSESLTPEFNIRRTNEFAEDNVSGRTNEVPPRELTCEENCEHSEVKMSSNNMEVLSNASDIMLKNEPKVDVPGSINEFPTFDLDEEKNDTEHSELKTPSNKQEVPSDISHVEVTDESKPDMVHMNPCDFMGTSLSLEISSICKVPDSPKPVLMAETHLQLDEKVTETVNAEADDYNDASAHPYLIGSPSFGQIKLQEEYLFNGNSELSKLEMSEAHTPEHILPTDDQKEVNQLELSTENLNEQPKLESHDSSSSKLLQSSYDSLELHDPPTSELLENIHDCSLQFEHAPSHLSHLHLSDGLWVPKSSDETNQEWESKSTYQTDFSENAKDAVSSPTHLLQESGFPSEQVLELQADKPNIESCHDDEESSKLSDLQCEQMRPPDHIDQNGRFTASESSWVASQQCEAMLSPKPDSQSFGISVRDMDQFPSFDILPGATHQKLLEQQPTGPAIDLPVLDPNALQAELEMPPLPPLPPIQWRMGKLQNGSLTSERAMVQSSLNPFLPLLSATSDEKAKQGLSTFERETTPPTNSLSLPSACEDEKPQHDSETFGGKILNSSLNPFLPQPPVMVDDENSEHCFQTCVGEMPNLNPFFPSPPPEDEKPQHSTLASGEETMQPSLNQFTSLQSTIKDMNSRHAFMSLQGESVEPLSLLAPKPNIEDEMLQQSSLSPERGITQHLDLSVLPMTVQAEKPPHPSLSSEGEVMWPMGTFEQLPNVEDGRANGKIQIKQPRPRDPLIEAVASHDKSTLRKVEEWIRPLVGPRKDERDSLLEQIRAKSFNLKPVVTTRPIIQRSKTNLNVVAILEKANAMRQALVGSDEDDGDSWSDS